MKPTAVISRLIVVFLALACPITAALAAEKAAVEPGAPPTALTSGSLMELWLQRHAARGRGDVLAADAIEDELRLRRRTNGVALSEDVAGLFVLEGYENLELKQFAEAREAFGLALEFAPQMPRAWVGLARTEWESGAGIGTACAALVQGIRSVGGNWLYRSMFLIAVAWVAILGVVLAAFVFLLLLFIKAFPLVHHDLTETLQRWLPPTAAATLAALLPFLPLGLPWGAAWTPLFWFALMLPVLSRGERLASSVLLLVAAGAAFVAPLAARATAEAADPRLVHVAGAAQGGIGPDRFRTLAELVARKPDDAVLQLLLADQARGFGRNAQAVEGYERATQLDPSLSHAYNNAGTLYFSLGRYATAVGQFRKAIEVAPDHMVAHYNLYLTQEHRFDFAAAEQTLAQAQDRNLTVMTELLSERQPGDERLDIVEDHVPVSQALSHARAAMAGEENPPMLAGALPSSAALVFPVLAVIFGAWRMRRQTPPVRCSTCGRIACRHCSLAQEDDQRCATCLALATRATSLPRRARQQKRREIESYRRRLGRLCRLSSALVPGGGQVWSGRPFLGSALLLLASGGLAIVLLQNMLPAPGYSPISRGPEPLLVAGLCLMAGTWLLGVLLPSRPRHLAGRRAR